ncbi:MAG: M28 family metallopeptidase [Candidatus Bathyarchaeota archaeon]|nr:M28 family metallopeptidase [Candidatus Bathyarchaeota archaeon]
MIWLTEEDRELLKDMEAMISKEEMQANWEAFMELTPIHSGSEEEEEAFRFLKAKLEEYGLEPEMLRYDAYISDPKYAKLEILQPLEMELKCTPYRQVGTTGPEGIEGEVIYIAPEDLGRAACKDKIVLCEQQTTGDWMGLRAGLLLRLQERGIKGLIVIEQDSYKPDVVHQRADFSVSGNPTSDNIAKVQTIPAIVHLTNRDGDSIRGLVKQGGVRARVTSVVETGWRDVGLLVAEIRGEVEPERFILVNAHVDTPPFSPGVVDNASGDVAVLELARILQMNRERLRRSVRIAFWSAHEIGRYAGSTYFNDHFWHDLRYNCVASYNIDSPGAKGANTFRAAPISEVLEAALDSIKSATGIDVESLRWPTRAGDGSFWGTGVPHTSLTSSRPPEDYDPHVNYSGGGWWWHTPHASMEHGDIEVLKMDVRVELNYIFKMINCPVLPLNFSTYSEHILKILKEYQTKADGVRDQFNLDPVLARAEEFRDLARELEDMVKSIPKKGNPSEPLRQELNHCLLWVSRHINTVAHSDAGPTEQVSMETFGATPFPRIAEITRLAGMDPETPEFGFLRTKLIRQRNAVEDGFYQASELIRGTLERLRLLTI